MHNEPKQEQKVRSPIVAVLGHVDHGKCLHPSEEVYINGGRARISKLFNFSLEEADSGSPAVIERKISLPTIEKSGRIIEGNTLQVWRLPYKGYLYKVTLKDGSSVTVTPEHPFLTLKGWVKAEDLRKDDPVAVALKIPFSKADNASLAIDKHSRILSTKNVKINSYNPHIRNSKSCYVKGKLRNGNSYYDYKGIVGRYFITFGETTVSPPSVVFHLTSRERSLHLKHMLLELGIHSIIQNTGNEIKLTIIGDENLNKFIKILTNGIKKRFYEFRSSSGKHFPDPTIVARYGDLGFVRIAKINRISYKGFVYDLTVPHTNAFISNGIIVHNTTLLDKIRGTAVVSKEPGEMTQHVGASMIPASVIEKIVHPLKSMFPIKLTIPGLLFIDTPGHEAFSNLRRRGGSIADFAILVVDIMEGVKQQTKESIQILLDRKVPFTVAANKIDRIYGWKSQPDKPFTLSIKVQNRRTIEELERRLYTLVGQLAQLGIPADRFDKIRDFRRTIAIVPISAKTGEGLPELLAILAGLTQRYLTTRILFTSGPAKGVVLEVKEAHGLGTCIDVIIYDGILRKGDTIVVGGFQKPIVTKIRALLMPKPLKEMRVVGESEFMSIEEVVAAAGVRISAPGLDDALAGAPLYAVKEMHEIPVVVKKVSEEVTHVRFSKKINGVIVKADTLGTLEALVTMLEKKGIPVRLADVGPLRKNEAIEASIVKKNNRYLGAALLFNVKPLAEAEDVAAKEGIKIFQGTIIYRLIEEYEKWVKEEKSKELMYKLRETVFPAKIRVLPGYVFRRKDPAIVGIRVLRGVIRPGYPLMRSDGRHLGSIYQIQFKGKNVDEAPEGSEVAISIAGNVLVGRHFSEGDILYTDPSERDLEKVITEFRNIIDNKVIDLIKEIIKIKQQKDRKFGLSILFRLKHL